MSVNRAKVAELIHVGFVWGEAPEGFNFWLKLHEHYAGSSPGGCRCKTTICMGDYYETLRKLAWELGSGGDSLDRLLATYCLEKLVENMVF